MLVPVSIPVVNMAQVQAAEVMKTYWLLYQEMRKDFVHKRDLTAILESSILTGVASPPDFILKGRVTWAVPSATETAGLAAALAYKGAFRTGDAVKEGIAKGIEEILGE